MRERVLDIHPACRAEARVEFYPFPLDFTAFDYVADCVDTVTAKLALIEACRSTGTPVISCMGTGNKARRGRVRGIADRGHLGLSAVARDAV